MLKGQNQVFKIEKHVHNYPHCWRTDKPVLYYPLDSWFIRTYRLQGAYDRVEQDDQLETGKHRYGTFRQVAGKPAGLEPEPFALLGYSVAYLAYGRR